MYSIYFYIITYIYLNIHIIGYIYIVFYATNIYLFIFFIYRLQDKCLAHSDTEASKSSCVVQECNAFAEHFCITCNQKFCNIHGPDHDQHFAQFIKKNDEKPSTKGPCVNISISDTDEDIELELKRLLEKKALRDQRNAELKLIEPSNENTTQVLQPRNDFEIMNCNIAEKRRLKFQDKSFFSDRIEELQTSVEYYTEYVEQTIGIFIFIIIALYIYLYISLIIFCRWK